MQYLDYSWPIIAGILTARTEKVCCAICLWHFRGDEMVQSNVVFYYQHSQGFCYLKQHSKKQGKDQNLQKQKYKLCSDLVRIIK